MPPTDETPATLRAVAAHLRDACDGPLGGEEACDRAAAIVEAVQDPMFLEAMMVYAYALKSYESGAATAPVAERCVRRAEAIGRVLELTRPGGER